MHIISKKKLREFILLNAQAKLPLLEWYTKMKANNSTNFNILKATFKSIDFVNGYTIFDIGGNNYRLITAIHYKTQRCYIRTIWTHAEYSKKHNQILLQRGDL